MTTPAATAQRIAQAEQAAADLIAHWAKHPELRTSIYIAGPMTGLPEFNYPAFNAAAKALRAQGITVANPAEHIEPCPDPTWADWMRVALRAMLSCRAVLLLPGWEASKGARIERLLAADLGMPAYDFPRGAPLWMGLDFGDPLGDRTVWVGRIMDQAQVYASTWSLVGSQIDDSEQLSNAEREKSELEYLVRRSVAAAPAQPQTDLTKRLMRAARREALNWADRVAIGQAIAFLQSASAATGGSVQEADLGMPVYGALGRAPALPHHIQRAAELLRREAESIAENEGRTGIWSSGGEAQA